MWQRLSEAFADEQGVIGKSIVAMQEVDSENKLRIELKYRGYDKIIHSFIEYWHQTLTDFQKLVPAPMDDDLAIYLSVLTPCFGRFRQSWEVFLTGHYIDGISLLRHVYQTVLIIAADQNPTFDLTGRLGKIGTKTGQTEEARKSTVLHRGFVSLEKEAVKLVVGSKSELNQATIESLENFLRNMHGTVHPFKQHALLNLLPAFYNQLLLFPNPDEEQLSQYMNISAFIGWMTLRILTLLNRHGQLSHDNWVKRTKALDGAFEAHVTEFAGLGRSIGKSILELIDKKFTFNTSIVLEP